MKKRQTGMTLIELLIVLAVVAIVSGIAVSTYENSVSKSRRKDAMSTLQGLAQAMERHYTSRGTYQGAAGTNLAPVDTGAPWVYSNKSPVDGTLVYYNLTIEAADATSYQLRATPTAAQGPDGIIELLSTGVKGWDRDNSGTFEPNEQCWNESC